MRKFERYVLILLLAGYAYGQDRLVDINGVEARGRLMEITNTHVVFLKEGAEAPLEIDKKAVQGVIRDDGTIAYGSKYTPRSHDPDVPDTMLILRKGQKSRMIPLGARLEVWNTRRRSLAQGRLLATSDSTLTILGRHSNVITVDGIIQMRAVVWWSSSRYLIGPEDWLMEVIPSE